MEVNVLWMQKSGKEVVRKSLVEKRCQVFWVNLRVYESESNCCGECLNEQ